MAKWVIDADHSVAAFVVKHMMITNVRGQFNKLSGQVSLDEKDPSRSSVEVSIDATGVYTGISKRDEHLRSADFFDVAKYPQIVFKSANVKALGTNQFEVRGDLTIHGTTRPMILNVKSLGTEKSPEDETSIGFAASTLIDRRDFGMSWDFPLPSGGVMVGTEITIYLDIEADLEP